MTRRSSIWTLSNHINFEFCLSCFLNENVTCSSAIYNDNSNSHDNNNNDDNENISNLCLFQGNIYFVCKPKMLS